VEERVRVVCLDLEGVLIPEMWIMVAEATRIDDLRVTTRDIEDYDELMQHRLGILEDKKISLADIQQIIGQVSPLPGAVEFLNALRRRWQAVVLSDTFVEFAGPAMEKLGWPFLLCNDLVVDENQMITGYRLRQSDGKKQSVEALKGLNVEVLAIGDSFNDISMLRAADQGFLFKPSDAVCAAHPDLPRHDTHEDLLRALIEYR
jgi:phosphoserine/homoserine phosphotransferase